MANPLGVERDYRDLILGRQTISDSNARIALNRYHGGGKCQLDGDYGDIDAGVVFSDTPSELKRQRQNGFHPPMSIEVQHDLAEYCREAARRAQAASGELALLTGDVKNGWLRESAARLRAATDHLLEANQADLAAAPGFGLTAAQIDRLKLSPQRIEEIAVGLEEVAALPDPVGETIESSIRPNGLEVLKTSGARSE